MRHLQRIVVYQELLLSQCQPLGAGDDQVLWCGMSLEAGCETGSGPSRAEGTLEAGPRAKYLSLMLTLSILWAAQTYRLMQGVRHDICCRDSGLALPLDFGILLLIDAIRNLFAPRRFTAAKWLTAFRPAIEAATWLEFGAVTLHLNCWCVQLPAALGIASVFTAPTCRASQISFSLGAERSSS
jgi:hypothetical protein